jgi:hypothetical protein
MYAVVSAAALAGASMGRADDAAAQSLRKNVTDLSSVARRSAPSEHA